MLSRVSSSSLRRIGRRIPNRTFSFSFAGPRTLEDILKKEMVEDKSAAEVADIWANYHSSKENVHGLVLKAGKVKSLLSRAAQSPFFVQPVFREDGYFMMISQFQEPAHFLMAYLEDYKMDPVAAQPLLTFSVFDDFAEEKEIVLVRADVLNRGLDDTEGLKVVRNMLDVYADDAEYESVHAFNKAPDQFDFDDFVSRQNEKWRAEAGMAKDDDDDDDAQK